MNKFLTKRGFTLPEVLVSLAVLTMVIVASTNLVVSIIRTNNDNINTLMAYGLAQEGLEGFRNIRDSNWLLGADFGGEIKGTVVWELFPTKDEEKTYVIDLYKMGAVQTTPSISLNQISGVAPWKLEEVTASNLEGKSLVKKFPEIGGGSGFRYGHFSIQGVDDNSNAISTPFHRYLVVEGLDEDDGKLTKMRVKCVVYWQEGSRARDVTLTTELSDWNQGQL